MRVEVIGPEELNEKVATSPGDVSMLLNETSGLHVQMTSPGLGAANVRIDGLRRTQPLVLPQRAPHGRWTVDAWGPLDGRVVNLALRWRFGGGESP